MFSSWFPENWALPRLTVSLLALALTVLGPGASPAGAQDVYPQGSAFPLQLYALVPDRDIALVAPDGWNIGHRYGWANGGTGTDSLNAYLHTLALSGMDGLTPLPAFGDISSGRTEWAESDIAVWIGALAANTNIAYWDLPEELRYWIPWQNEFQVVQDYTTWTRTYDPLQRPNFMYIPGHYTQAQILNYVPYLDIIPATAYADHLGQPHAWVRWRMEETLRAINQAGAVIGSDYLNGEKTPVGIIQLFAFSDPVIPSAEQTYHDFWQLIASGAKGIFVYSYSRRNDQSPALIRNWNRLREAASQLSGPEQLGAMVLYGQPVTDVTATVRSGPAQTVSFTPVGSHTPVQFPSIHLFCQQWNGSNYLIAVNSTDQSVTASFANLPPAGGASATVLFESRSVPISGASFTDSFPAWGVHIYQF